MTDLHSHLLPGIDDGAKTLADAVAMLKMQQSDGVRTVCVTPHFYPGRETPDEFLARRAAALEQLLPAAALYGIRLVEGAEAAISENLPELDRLDELCLAGSGTLLVELPAAWMPPWTENVLDELLAGGIRPLLAHVERYSYFRSDLSRLERLVRLGCYAHVTASNVVRTDEVGKASRRMLRRGLAQVLGSDAHSPSRRPPRMGEAARRLGARRMARIEQTAAALLTSHTPPPQAPAHGLLAGFGW